PLALGPGKRLVFVLQIQPVEARCVHLGIDAGLPEQGLSQLRIIILRPVRQRRDRRAVTPWIQRRNDTASGPGSLASRLARFEQNHALPRTRQQVSRKQAYDSAAHHYRHLSRHIPPASWITYPCIQY